MDWWVNEPKSANRGEESRPGSWPWKISFSPETGRLGIILGAENMNVITSNEQANERVVHKRNSKPSESDNIVKRSVAVWHTRWIGVVSNSNLTSSWTHVVITYVVMLFVFAFEKYHFSFLCCVPPLKLARAVWCRKTGSNCLDIAHSRITLNPTREAQINFRATLHELIIELDLIKVAHMQVALEFAETVCSHKGLQLCFVAISLGRRRTLCGKTTRSLEFYSKTDERETRCYWFPLFRFSWPQSLHNENEVLLDFV